MQFNFELPSALDQKCCKDFLVKRRACYNIFCKYVYPVLHLSSLFLFACCFLMYLFLLYVWWWIKLFHNPRATTAAGRQQWRKWKLPVCILHGILQAHTFVMRRESCGSLWPLLRDYSWLEEWYATRPWCLNMSFLATTWQVVTLWSLWCALEWYVTVRDTVIVVVVAAEAF